VLKGKVQITFTLEGTNYKAGEHFRVAFNFGENKLFTGQIRSSDSEYVSMREYCVDVDFFTVCDEAYEAIKHLLEDGMRLTVQAGSRVIGWAKLLSYSYGN
jgi:hypothetical protein